MPRLLLLSPVGLRQLHIEPPPRPRPAGAAMLSPLPRHRYNTYRDRLAQVALVTARAVTVLAFPATTPLARALTSPGKHVAPTAAAASKDGAVLNCTTSNSGNESIVQSGEAGCRGGACVQQLAFLARLRGLERQK